MSVLVCVWKWSEGYETHLWVLALSSSDLWMQLLTVGLPANYPSHLSHHSLKDPGGEKKKENEGVLEDRGEVKKKKKSQIKKSLFMWWALPYWLWNFGTQNGISTHTTCIQSCCCQLDGQIKKHFQPAPSSLLYQVTSPSLFKMFCITSFNRMKDFQSLDIWILSGSYQRNKLNKLPLSAPLLTSCVGLRASEHIDF